MVIYTLFSCGQEEMFVDRIVIVSGFGFPGVSTELRGGNVNVKVTHYVPVLAHRGRGGVAPLIS
jgi:hypothetical protein